MTRHNFRNLKIWQDRPQFFVNSYQLTNKFPKSGLYNLISQINSCTLSIPYSISERRAKLIDKHFEIYLETSLESAYEWETPMEAAILVGFVNNEDYDKLLPRIQKSQKIIGAFIDRLS